MGESEAEYETWDPELEYRPRHGMVPDDPAVARAVSINPADLRREFIELSSIMAYWHAKLADAKDAVTRAKNDRDYWRSSEYARARERLEHDEVLRAQADGTKAYRVTEAAVDKALDAEEEWLELQSRLADTELAVDKLRGVIEALKTKRDMLVSLGAHDRAEMSMTGHS